MTTSVKDYLKEYRSSMAKAQRIRCVAEAHKVSACETEKELKKHLSKAAEIEDFISSADNFIHREILTRKYIYGETVEEIAEAMCYSPRHITRLLSSATESLESHLPS